MRGGRVSAELSGSELTEERVLTAAFRELEPASGA
jgi:hypothetical protein